MLSKIVRQIWCEVAGEFHSVFEIFGQLFSCQSKTEARYDLRFYIDDYENRLDGVTKEVTITDACGYRIITSYKDGRVVEARNDRFKINKP
jgi:hypothetical protein